MSRSPNDRGATATRIRLPTGLGPEWSGMQTIARIEPGGSTSGGT